MTKMRRKEYEEELQRLQVELVQMQRWVVEEHAKVCIVFEGRDTAGKRRCHQAAYRAGQPPRLPGRGTACPERA